MTSGDDQRPGARFRPDIQGLRAIAVLLVVLFHAHLPFLPGGFVGVDVFFVISGFLITGQIVSAAADGRFRFGEFYAKRARRILPASFAVVLLSVIAAAIWMPPLQLEQVLGAAAGTVLYVPNLYFAVRGLDYFSGDTLSVFQQYWSLGVEEQFYLVWPALIVIVLLSARGSRRALGWVLAVVVLASFLAGLVLTFVSPTWAFYLLPTRAWELGAGALVQLAIMGGLRARPVVATVAAGAGLLAVVGSAVLLDERAPYPGAFAAIPVIGTAALLFAGATAEHGRSPLGVLLASRPFQFVGEISYSVYLVHWPLLVIPLLASDPLTPLPLWLSLLLGAASIPVGWLLYRLVERPFRRLPALARRRPRATLLWSAGVTGVAIATIGASVLVVGALPFATSRSAPITDVSAPVVGTPYVPSNLEPGLSAGRDDIAAIYIGGCGGDDDEYTCERGDPQGSRTIALFGDSHAGQWYPALDALAAASDARLLVTVKHGCPPALVEIIDRGVKDTGCEQWRQDRIAQFLDDPPDVIIISSYGLARDVEPRVTLDEWRAGLRSTFDILSPISTVVLIADTPRLGAYPPYCLSAHLEQADACGLPRSEAVNIASHDVEAAVASEAGVEYWDLTDRLCSPTFCPAIIGNTLVYHDVHHLSATMALRLSPALAKGSIWE